MGDGVGMDGKKRTAGKEGRQRDGEREGRRVRDEGRTEEEERGELQRDLKGWHLEGGTQGSWPAASRFGVALPLFCILWPEDTPYSGL